MGMPQRNRSEMLGLDQRIVLVEQRLVEREQRVHAGVARVKQDVRHKMQPRRWLPIVAAGAGVLVLWSLVRRRGSEAAVTQGMRDDARPSSGLPLGQLFALAWPLAPASWRVAINPALLSTAASVMSALTSGILRRRSARVPRHQAAQP